MARRLGTLAIANAASPAYLKKHGTPRTLADLATHHVVQYMPSFGTSPATFDYFDGHTTVEIPTLGGLAVNNTEAYQVACVAGFGIIQAPRYGLRAKLASGALVEILREFGAEPMPVSLVFVKRRHMPQRLAVFMDWLAEILKPVFEG